MGAGDPGSGSHGCVTATDTLLAEPSFFLSRQTLLEGLSEQLRSVTATVFKSQGRKETSGKHSREKRRTSEWRVLCQVLLHPDELLILHRLEGNTVTEFWNLVPSPPGMLLALLAYELIVPEAQQ